MQHVNTMNSSKVGSFFPNLQIVRGIAALLVVLNHIYSKESFFPNIQTQPYEQYFVNLGVSGLTLFFCLSGFLITYILLNEKQHSDTIHIKRFYLRRVLRIWPLYFVMIIIGQFILPYFVNSNFEGGDIHSFFAIKSLLYLVFLPNYVFFIFQPHNPFIDVTWSIGTEEQFYFFWPHCIKRVKSLFILCLVLIFSQLIAELFTMQLNTVKGSNTFYFLINKLIKTIEWSKAGYFGLGAISAIVYQRKLILENGIVANIIKYSPIILACTFLLNANCFFPCQFMLLGLSYCCFQLALLDKFKGINKQLNQVFQWLGKISYSVYLWHCIVIVFVLKWFTQLNIVNTPFISILLYFSIISITLVIATISYHLIEAPFLKFKDKLK